MPYSHKIGICNFLDHCKSLVSFYVILKDELFRPTVRITLQVGNVFILLVLVCLLLKKL